jgi:hypothetical protein
MNVEPNLNETHTATTTLVLSKLLSDAAKEVRSLLSPGKYQVDEIITMRVSAALKIGEDYNQRITQKANPWGLVYVLLEELQEKALAAGQSGIDLDRLVRLASCVDEDLSKQAKERADKIAAALKEETWQTCNGKTSVSGIVEVLK